MPARVSAEEQFSIVRSQEKSRSSMDLFEGETDKAWNNELQDNTLQMALMRAIASVLLIK